MREQIIYGCCFSKTWCPTKQGSRRTPNYQTKDLNYQGLPFSVGGPFSHKSRIDRRNTKRKQVAGRTFAQLKSPWSWAFFFETFRKKTSLFLSSFLIPPSCLLELFFHFFSSPENNPLQDKTTLFFPALLAFLFFLLRFLGFLGFFLLFLLDVCFKRKRRGSLVF